MLRMINSFPIKALNLLQLSALSHAGTIFPVSDTSSLGGDSALQAGVWHFGKCFTAGGSTKQREKGMQPETAPGHGRAQLAQHCSQQMFAQRRDWKSAQAAPLRSVLVTLAVGNVLVRDF